MKPILRVAPCLLVAALACVPWAARAQSAWASTSDAYRLQFYVGGSVGATVFADRRGETAGWLESRYASTTSLSPGDYIVTFSRQDGGDIGGKIYAGAWITPNIAAEVGWATLGRINWSAYSTNSTGSFSTGDSGSVAPHAWYEAVLLGLDAYGVRYFVKGGAYEASTDMQASSFNYSNGAAYGPSTSVHNTGGLVGVGIHTGYHHTAFRLEVEDFLNVGTANMPLTQSMPPWRGSVWLISAGVAYMF